MSTGGDVLGLRRGLGRVAFGRLDGLDPFGIFGRLLSFGVFGRGFRLGLGLGLGLGLRVHGFLLRLSSRVGIHCRLGTGDGVSAVLVRVVDGGSDDDA
jgi:hypothetical protein